MASPVRFAVVGLGHIAKKAVLPAFQNTTHAVCTAIVTGQPAAPVGKRYGYGEYERALQSGEFDAVYLALPNHRHKEFAVKAAAAGRHILCEKPLAVTEAEAQEMVDAAKQHDVRLMVAYRHQFSDAHRHAVGLARSGALGELRSFHSIFTLDVRPNTQRTARRSQGGGTLPDIGVYCLNSARQFFGAEPTAMECSLVSRTDDPRFRDVEEMCDVTLVYPGHRLASFTCGFGSSRVMTYTIVGTKGGVSLDPAYDYGSDTHCIEVIDGQRRGQLFPKVDQFAREIDHFAECIQTGQPHRATGEEGVQDVRLIEQLYAAARPLA